MKVWLRLERPTDEDLQQGQSFSPGYCHFPRYSEEYFKQITAEQLVTKIVKGYRRHEWQKMRERNEALDCRVYARAAANRIGLDRYQDKHWQAIEDRMGVPKTPENPSPAAPAAPAGSRPQPQQRQPRRRTWGPVLKGGGHGVYAYSFGCIARGVGLRHVDGHLRGTKYDVPFSPGIAARDLRCAEFAEPTVR